MNHLWGQIMRGSQTEGKSHDALAYRPEIDGLRALAVIPVLLFHANLGIQGGYVGVDVFFVISGFLITSILLRDIVTDRFSFVAFMERRIRRIVPAMLTTVAATMVVSWFVLLPDDYKRLGKAAISQVFMVSNIYHWSVAGYFGQSAESLPLLHTWSLSVEEQYYLILPALLVTVGWWNKALIPKAIVLVCVASFVLGCWSTPRYSNFSFYMLPVRAWELLLGSILASMGGAWLSNRKWLREAVSLGGLMAIIAAMATFKPTTSFPGYHAALPCLGAVAFIWANGRCLTRSGSLLASLPIRFVGKISYSLYLVHWPIFVLYRYWIGEDLTATASVGMIVASFAAAVVQWRVVEQPFRNKALLDNRRTLFIATPSAIGTIVAIGVLLIWQKGFPNRINAEVMAVVAARNEREYVLELTSSMVKNGEVGFFGRGGGAPECLLWGDSHAMAMVPALDCVCGQMNMVGVQATHSCTPPLAGFKCTLPHSLLEDTEEFGNSVIQYAIDNKIKKVVLVSAWTGYSRLPLFEPSLKSTVESLTNAGIQVVIVRDVANLSQDIVMKMAKAALAGKGADSIGAPYETHMAANRDVNRMFEALAGPMVTVVDPAPYFVDSNGLWRAVNQGKPLYRDRSHLSVAGALRLVPLFREVLKR